MIEEIRKVKSKIIRAAKRVIRQWHQDDKGTCPKFGYGGICLKVAIAMGRILKKEGFHKTDILSVNFWDAEYEDYEIGHCALKVIDHKTNRFYVVDLHPDFYENLDKLGVWRQIKNPRINDDDLTILTQNEYCKKMEARIYGN